VSLKIGEVQHRGCRAGIEGIAVSCYFNNGGKKIQSHIVPGWGAVLQRHYKLVFARKLHFSQGCDDRKTKDAIDLVINL